MATGLVSPGKHLRECAVCLDDMLDKTPKLLDCKHSYCSPCLSKLTTSCGPKRREIRCPKCKHKTVLKSGELSDLPDNFLLQEVKAVLDNHAQYYHCFYCNKLNIDCRATSLCTRCHRYMCTGCTEKHKGNAIYRHVIIFLLDKQNSECCLKHGEPVQYACRACSPVRPLCDVCITLDDPCHDAEEYIDYTTALSEEESKLRLELRKVDDILSEYKAKVKTEAEQVKGMASLLVQGKEKAANLITCRIEQSPHLKSVTSAAKSVRQSKQKAEDLLKHDKTSLKDVSQAKEDLRISLSTLADEEEKVKTSGLETDLITEIRIVVYKILSTEVSPTKSTTDEDRLKLVFSWKVKEPVSKLKPSRDGRVIYVSWNGTVITELSSDGETRLLQTEHLTYSGGLSVDTRNTYLYFLVTTDTGKFIHECEIRSAMTQAFPSRSALTGIHSLASFVIADLCCLGADSVMLVGPSGVMYNFDVSSWNLQPLGTLPYEDDNIQLTAVTTGGREGFLATYVTRRTIIHHDRQATTLRTINKDGCPIKQPRATTINGEGNILVADFETSKIIEVTMAGEFVKDVLTEKDGLINPVKVVFSPPYLWVADHTKDGKNTLKCFRM